MKLKEISSFLDSAVPLSFQESYDNSGLQVGLPDRELRSALITLDVTEDVIDEAITGNHDLVISHHPLIFAGIKSITGRSMAERILYKCINNNIAVYSSHTNLDICKNGVSRKMAEMLGLQEIRVLSPLEKKLLKLVTYVPESHLDKLRDAIFEAGAGVTGNYDNCGFVINGTGSFRAGDQAAPFVGRKGIIHFEKESRFETVLFSHMREKVIEALKNAHPYEEVAYDIYTLENQCTDAGLGCTGIFSEPMSEQDFLKHVASVFDAKGVRYSAFTGSKVKKVAICGGSGAHLIKNAIACGADAFVTADIKYHNFFDAENKLLLVDTGHFESEKSSIEILYELIIKKFPKFAVRFSETNTNPINYL